MDVDLCVCVGGGGGSRALCGEVREIVEAVHRAEEGLERYWVNYEKSII